MKTAKNFDDLRTPSSIKALLNSKCPRCREGKMFVGPVYGFRQQRFNEICPHCGLRFEIEPGYFYAAMYVSYALVVVEVLFFAFLTHYFLRADDPWPYVITLFITIFAFSPVNFRYSRLILLHYMTPKVKYDPKYKINKNENNS